MTEWKFQRDAIQCFEFRRSMLDPATGMAELVYGFDDGPDLVERIGFPGAPFDPALVESRTVQRALQLLHFIAGISYYKAAVPPRIAFNAEKPDVATAALLTDVYVNGLGEFAYRNGVDVVSRAVFPSRVGEVGNPSGADSVLPPSSETDHALVAIGGGKDSLVSIEALRSLGHAPQTLAWVGSSGLIAACAARTGLPTLNVSRALAPALFEFNRMGAWNGHIPVTAINSAILVLAATLHGKNQVVFSNERSASYGSTIPGTGEVNHQWSKSWAFEQVFGAHVQTHVAPGLAYYSLLRPFSELAVARQFARTPQYDDCFSSCNRNFHLLGERPTERWCGVCPKCHFVFLALAPFMSKTRLVAIFGRNLLDEPALAPAFDALLEFGAHKPFECVGEGREARAAMAALSARADWREDALIARFARQIAPHLDAAELSMAPLLDAQGPHRIPERHWTLLRAYFGA